VFTLVNLALIAIKRRGEQPAKGFAVPAFVPICGAALAPGLL
jgi:hypothetical protein